MMNKQSLFQILAVGIVTITTGCGAIPEAIVDVATNSARKAIAENIDETVQDLVDDFVDLENLPIPLGNDLLGNEEGDQ